ncbi:MAG: hypothetical protein RBR71_00750 [Gudongella sp.]|nr:hypothetical protein [Gudongella sp.]
MKFEKLSKKHQDFLMYCLGDYIKGKVRKDERNQIIEPTYEQYKDFFNEFDEEYEIVDGLPESEACNRFSVKFKVVLEVDK